MHEKCFLENKKGRNDNDENNGDKIIWYDSDVMGFFLFFFFFLSEIY